MVAAVVFQAVPAGIGGCLEGPGLARVALLLSSPHTVIHMSITGGEGLLGGAADRGDGPIVRGGDALNTSSRH